MRENYEKSLPSWTVEKVNENCDYAQFGRRARTLIEQHFLPAFINIMLWVRIRASFGLEERSQSCHALWSVRTYVQPQIRRDQPPHPSKVFRFSYFLS